jgi:hypothetical protein
LRKIFALLAAGDADAVVAHADHDLAVAGVTSTSMLALARVLDGVGQQVLDRPLDGHASAIDVGRPGSRRGG